MTVVCSTAIRSRAPLEQALATISRSGLGPIDLLAIEGWVHVNPSDLAARWDATVERVDQLLSEHALRPLVLNSATGPQLHDRSAEADARRRRELDALTRWMRHLGVGLAAIQPRNADPGRPWAEVLDDCVATLREQLAAGRAAGVEFALELHSGSPFETPHQARALLERLPELPLVYDPSHFVMQGIALRDTAWLMQAARHVHLRDAAAGTMQAPFGSGEVDFDWVLGTLRERGYSGHISIEYLESDAFDVVDSALRLREAIGRYFPA